MSVQADTGRSATNSEPAHPVECPTSPKPRHYKRNFLAFWFMGMINNFYYCIVLDAADHLADEFHLKSYIALIPWANIFWGLFAKLSNAFLFTRLSYNWRAVLTAAITTFGLVVTATCPYWGNSDVFRFIIALIGITAIGVASAYGESFVLGYVEGFPPKLVGAWSSGTGMSGVAAALLYLFFIRVCDLSNTATFLLMLPWVAVYLSMYFFVLRVNAGASLAGGSVAATGEGVGQRLRLLASPAGPDRPNGDAEAYASNWRVTSWGRLPQLTTSQPATPSTPRAAESPVTLPDSGHSREPHGLLSRVKRLLRLTWFNNLNLSAVYICEYAAQFMAPFAFPCVAQKHSDKFVLKNAYVLSQFAYQIGVLCSRSSLACFRIRRVWILSVLQLINGIGWLLQAKLLYLSSDYVGDPAGYSGSEAEAKEEWMAAILLLWMFYVGLLGGASYVNVFYNILQLPELSPISGASSVDESDDLARKRDRELAMNIGSIFGVVGITLGSVVDLIFSNTILTDTTCS